MVVLILSTLRDDYGGVGGEDGAGGWDGRGGGMRWVEGYQKSQLCMGKMNITSEADVLYNNCTKNSDNI